MKGILFILLAVFLILGIGASWLSSLKETPEKKTVQIAANLKVQIDKMNEEASQVLKSNSLNGFLGSEKGRAYYIYRNGELLAWSTNEFVPESHSIIDTTVVHFLRMGGSDFLIREWKMSDDRTLIGLLLLFRQYKISNAYLQPQWNQSIFGHDQPNLHDQSIGGGRPVIYKAKELFRMDLSTESSTEWIGNVGSAAYIAAIICSMLIISVYIRSFRRRQPDIGFLIIGVLLFGIRAMMISSGFPSAYLNQPMFDPQYFASSEWNPSLGDLFFNSIALFVLCLMLFRTYYRFHLLHRLLKGSISSLVLDLFSATACYFGLLYPFIVVQTIYNNSAISLNISGSLGWDGLRIVSFLVVVLSALSAFLFIHIFLRILSRSKQIARFLVMLAVGLCTFIVVNEMTGQLYTITAILGSIYLIIAYRTKLVHSSGTQGYAAFAYFTFAILCFSIEMGYGVRHFAEKEQTQSQIRFASNFLVDRDYLGEFLLNDARRQIEQDVFIQSRLSSPFLGKEAIRQKIRQVFLPAYLDRYVVDIRLFNSSGESLNDNNDQNFSSLINSYNGVTSDTEYPGVYVVSRLGPGLTQKYVVVARIQRNNLIQGYIVMEFSLKRYIPESVYPELLVDNRFQQAYQPENFSFAVLSGEKIVISYGDFDYERLRPERFIPREGGQSDSYEAFGYHHVIVDGGAGNKAIVSHKDDSLTLQLADYSFQFVLGILVLLLILLGQGVRTILYPRNLLISARIQLLLNVAFFAPLVLVSVISMTLVSGAFKDKMNEEYRNKSEDFAGQLSRLMSDEDPRTDQTGNQLTNWSKLADVDANLYAPDGKLEASSQPLIFENQLQAPYLSPRAMQTVTDGSHNFIATEHIGKLNYFVSYATLRSPETGKLLGVLGIPYFQSGRSLERMQITVLSNIISIFSVVFIFLLIAFYFISRWFTYPFKLITSSLERTSLTDMNRPLEWQSNDEIGMMVRQYNEMLNNLQASKAELERGQRELAWREIAQQVAHEIKNPLTPMKLKLQQLERMSQQSGDSEGNLHKAIEALLGQVEILNGIASSFSTFAKMPEPRMQKVELSTLIKRIADLHKSAGVISIQSDGAVTVLADEQLLSRIISNLILNAEQASDPKRKLQIHIRLNNSRGRSQLTVQDNGTGMTEEIRQKAFLPQFSTKQSGSGLGLAIARQGIEQMGGTITFDSQLGVGTSFYIELPIVE